MDRSLSFSLKLSESEFHEVSFPSYFRETNLGSSNRLPLFHLNNEHISLPSTFTYLGVVLTRQTFAVDEHHEMYATLENSRFLRRSTIT